MDFFYVWLRRSLHDLSPELDAAFAEPLAPKWDHEAGDGELIDDASRFDGDAERSKSAYEDGMARVFQNCYRALTPEGRLVIVFAHKHPDAWETLVSAIIRAGFIVTGSWPIETEMGNRTRALSSAALASSVWLVCKKRPATARPGWDNRVLEEMRALVTERLRDFWDAGIRGPDFVWAATGPAMEAYSQYPVVKKADEPGQVLTVTEFLGHVRRMVVDFVVGRVLSGDGMETITGLDNLTTYYLLHRHDFGMGEAPAGAAILYAISCNLSDRNLADRYHLLEQTGSTLQLLPWHKRKSVGYDPVLDAAESQGAETLRLPGLEAPEATLLELPLIDQAHRLMHLWKAGDVTKVDAYLDARALRRNALFQQLLQALIELAAAGSEERALLESISNYLGVRGTRTGTQATFATADVSTPLS
jgi:SAM-dependent methyltransferase